MSETEAPAKPNLVFILPDRLRQDTSGAYGNDWVPSPQMDAMASERFVFEHCYVTQPVCAPARASIMTGLYPSTAGMQRRILAKLMKTSGMKRPVLKQTFPQSLKKLFDLRNDLMHRPSERPRPSQVETLLADVGDLLWHLDVYTGQDWAQSHIN